MEMGQLMPFTTTFNFSEVTTWSYSNRSIIPPTTAMGDQHHNISQRGQFVGMSNAGSFSEIARLMGVSRSTVRCWLQQLEESGNLKALPRLGWPILTRAADNMRIVADIRNHPFTNAVSTTVRLHLEVLARTFRQRLHGNGINHRNYLRVEVWGCGASHLHVVTPQDKKETIKA
ncbi:putative winged helix-turn-helix domain containing protein 4 [Homarus americanus]|uniref:Putative winged helix-turn-helix domain containing protein 4 n=1 Tax=Homarus americanus TaxID=6706 RepID=A0A8J5MZZ9_HOMAM|nr:putative winged helix-turn-helix domain containing protein 4 [Homarus americanus]